jgi:hypothetical protein
MGPPCPQRVAQNYTHYSSFAQAHLYSVCPKLTCGPMRTRLVQNQNMPRAEKKRQDKTFPLHAPHGARKLCSNMNNILPCVHQ